MAKAELQTILTIHTHLVATMKPLVFMDMDGVTRPALLPNDYKVNHNCLEWINKALDLMDADVVITSNWRLAYPLAYFNSIFNGRVIGKTRDIEGRHRGPYIRWYEIEEYLTATNKTPVFFLVFDDKDEYFPPNSDYLILCNPETGFTEANFTYVSQLFSKIGSVSVKPLID